MHTYIYRIFFLFFNNHLNVCLLLYPKPLVTVPINLKGFEKWERRGESLPENTTVLCGRLGTQGDDDNGSKKELITLTLSDREKKCLLRCLPEDEMNGFFVAVFRRTSTTKHAGKKEDRHPINEVQSSLNKKRKFVSDNEHEGKKKGISNQINSMVEVAVDMRGSKTIGSIAAGKKGSKEVASDQGSSSLFHGKKFKVRALKTRKVPSKRR